MIGETLLVGLGLLFPGAVQTAVRPPATEFRAATMLTLPAVGSEPAGYYQIVVERQLIIRIPARPSSLTSFSAGNRADRQARTIPVVWRETKAPKCVAVRSLLGIQTVQRDSIDLLTRENQRLRAKLKRGCRAADFYSGFYMKASKDGRLCADRDALHARSGAECEVEKFRLMVPVRQES
ncbi:MAG: hypothetical protein HC788_10455 [Sphingopyxis sp.]|nr:hypothetical protein [Sphingopyxis sp.]